MLPTVKTTIKNDFLSATTCIVGDYKVGKSTFASQLGDNVLFLSCEEGVDFLEVYKVSITKWSDFLDTYKLLVTTKHDFKVVAIDTIEKLIGFAEAEICREQKVASILDAFGGYGKGQAAARALLAPIFVGLRNKGIGKTYIAHPKESTFKQDSMEWTALFSDLSEKYEDFIFADCDFIFHAYVDSKDTTKRYIRTKPNKYIKCAGDRSGRLPEIMPMDAKLVIETLKKQPTPQSAVTN